MSDVIANKQQRNLGTFSSVVFSVGNIVGIGVFFKNISIFKNNDFNPIGVLLVWIIGSLIAISTAICFSKLCNNNKNHENSGIIGWIGDVLDIKVKKFLYIFLPICYFGLICFLLCIMVGEAFVNIFMQAFDFKIHFGFVLLIAVLILVAFIALNIFKPNAGSAFSKYTTLIKFIPILVIILMGCIYASIKGLGISYFSSSNEKVGNFMPLAMFSCLPAVLFSFDGFSVVGSLKSKIINPEKTLPRAMFYSMIVVSLTYILISLSEILVGADSAFELVDKILPQKMIIGVNIFLNVLVWLCVLSGCNGLTIATLNTTQAAIEERKIVGSDWILKKTNNKHLYAGTIYYFFVVAVLLVIVGIPCVILNNDAILDGASNTIVEFMFVIYGITIFWALFKKKLFNWKQSICAIISSISCFGVGLWSIIWTAGLSCLNHANESSNLGMLMGGDSLKVWSATIVFWCSVVIFTIVPLLNNWIVQKHDKMKIINKV